MTNKENKNKTVLITGATSGIGYELSNIFAQQGYCLVLTARNKAKLESIAEDFERTYGSKTEILAKDLSLASAPEEIFHELQDKSISVDILVNNAGFTEYGAFHQTDWQKELQMLQVNITSLTHLTKLFLPGMLKRGFGRILNVGSTGSFVPGPLMAVYCATKAYVLSFSDAIAEELEGTGVTVTTLCPGATKTDFAKRADVEQSNLFQGNVMDAKRVALTGYNALMKGRRIVIPGVVNNISICSTRFISRKTAAKFTKETMKASGLKKKMAPRMATEDGREADFK